jgi:hypothetical protein
MVWSFSLGSLFSRTSFCERSELYQPKLAQMKTVILIFLVIATIALAEMPTPEGKVGYGYAIVFMAGVALIVVASIWAFKLLFGL